MLTPNAHPRLWTLAVLAQLCKWGRRDMCRLRTTLVSAWNPNSSGVRPADDAGSGDGNQHETPPGGSGGAAYAAGSVVATRGGLVGVLFGGGR